MNGSQLRPYKRRYLAIGVTSPPPLPSPIIMLCLAATVLGRNYPPKGGFGQRHDLSEESEEEGVNYKFKWK